MAKMISFPLNQLMIHLPKAICGWGQWGEFPLVGTVQRVKTAKGD
jgi:hypothetical protein